MATVEEAGEWLLDWLGDKQPLDEADIASLNDAIYTLNESGLWPGNIEIRNPEVAILCWKLVHMLSREDLPDCCKL